MEIGIKWMQPQRLRKSRKDNETFAIEIDALPTDPAIYVFARKWGGGFEALYVGKADRCARRVRQQLNNHRLVKHLDSAKSGSRYLMVGVLKPKPGQRVATNLKIAERALIRHVLSEGHDLVNIMGTMIRRHEIVALGRKPRRFLQRRLFVES